MHVYRKQKQSRDGDKDTSKGKHYDRILLIIYRHLNRFYLEDTAPPTFIQKQRNRPPPKDEGGRQGP